MKYWRGSKNSLLFKTKRSLTIWTEFQATIAVAGGKMEKELKEILVLQKEIGGQEKELEGIFSQLKEALNIPSWETIVIPIGEKRIQLWNGEVKVFWQECEGCQNDCNNCSIAERSADWTPEEVVSGVIEALTRRIKALKEQVHKRNLLIKNLRK